MTTADLITAGAVLPGAIEPGDDRDTITARHYTHPALDDRVVVRLVPALLGVAEDLSCEYFGFAEPTSCVEVGTGKRSALGFPAWALINDPANGHHALNLVKEIERLARTAKAKAGNAKDGFVALGDMLGRSAPHFLPTFYEQAGRVFLDHGNTANAATMFGKAREAEDVHGLTVDPQRVREVFLEFAFAGALSAKVLSAHAKALARRHDPDVAYEQFLALCIERTRGGLPPYAGMPEDLRRLAKAAKRNLAEADEQLLRAVLDTSSINGAGAAFWKSYRKTLIDVARRDGAVRELLLRFVPSSVAALDTWLEILTACGATRALTEPATDEPATVSPSAWLSSVCRVRAAEWLFTTRSVRGLELVEAMGERLVADAQPVRAHVFWSTNELDLVDLLVNLGVPVTVPDRTPRFDISDWLRDDQPGKRDLGALARTEPYASALGDSLIAYLQAHASDGDADRAALVAALAVPGLRAALARWLTGRAEPNRPTGLPALAARLNKLAAVPFGEAFADVPAAAEAIAATDVVGALHTTLRAGLFDELGWPALDDAVTKLSSGGRQGERVVVCGEGWPALVVGRGETFVVVGPDGVLAEHIWRIPPDTHRSWASPRVSWFDGVLLVSWQGPDGERAYWSDAPTEVFTATATLDRLHHDTPPASMALGGDWAGARFGGRRAVRPGDRHIAMGEEVHGDGTSVWTTSYHDRVVQWLEVDPATGRRGRASLPAFLEDFAADGTRLALTHCYLRPTADTTTGSPLGAAGGRHGWRVRRQPDGSWLAEGVDGRRVQVPPDAPTPTGLLALPGGAELVVGADYRLMVLLDGHGDRLGQFAAHECWPEYAAGTPLVPPLHWWHLLRPRDEAGSAALRHVGREAVQQLVAAAEKELDRKRPSAAERYAALDRGERDPLATAVTTALPGMSHPGLIAGVIDMALRAARLRRDHLAFGPVAEAARQIDLDTLARSETVITQAQLDTALSWFDPNRFRYRRSSPSPASELPALLAALVEAAAGVPEGSPSGGNRWFGFRGRRASRAQRAAPLATGVDQKLPSAGGGQWLDVLPHVASLAYRAASPLTPDDERGALVFALGAIADSGFLEVGGQWRLVSVVVPADAGVRVNRVGPAPGGFIVPFTGPSSIFNNTYPALQYAAVPGPMALPRGWRLSESAELDQSFGRDRITRFLAVLAERGPIPWRPEPVSALAELTGLAAADATVLLAGSPDIDDRWGATYLDAAQRTLLGLSAAETKAVKQRLRGVPMATHRALLAAALPEDPALLWTTGPDVRRMAAVWTALYGTQRPVPDDVLLDASRQLRPEASRYVSGVLNADTARWLQVDADMRFSGTELIERNEGAFSVDALQVLPEVLLWLAQRLPVGSPLRAQLSTALALARRRVAHPGFAVQLHWTDPDRIRRLLGIELPPQGVVVDVRPWLHLVGNSHSVSYRLVVRPGLIDRSDRPLLDALGSRWVGAALDDLADEGLTAACAARAPDGVDPAAFPQDPTVTAAQVITELKHRLGLDEDAAVVYLQLLALPDPTDANTARWTGWKPARLKAARDALAATDLVVSAKRARAGRSLFLPGGWLALKAPHLPLESWKAPMFGFSEQPSGPILPRGPVAELFVYAWHRVLDGDAPGYEELRTGGRR